MNIERAGQFNLMSPHIGLRKHILHYNIVFPEGESFSENYTLMPDACGTLSLAFDGNRVIAELWGASVTPTLLGAEPGRYGVLMLIQLSPYGLYQITRQDQAAFADKRLLLKDVDCELFHSLQCAFLESANVAELVDTCDGILYRRMEREIVSEALLLAAHGIEKRHGHIQVREAARQAGYSERHLNRLFLAQIGTTIKSYARLVRFNYVLKHMQKSPVLFAALSQQAGYFDQAHFDKDFKGISGLTPQAYLRRMSDFYYDGA